VPPKKGWSNEYTDWQIESQTDQSGSAFQYWGGEIMLAVAGIDYLFLERCRACARIGFTGEHVA